MMNLLEIDAFEAWVVAPILIVFTCGCVIALLVLLVAAIRGTLEMGERGAAAFFGVLLLILVWLVVGSAYFAITDPSGLFESGQTGE